MYQKRTLYERIDSKVKTQTHPGTSAVVGAIMIIFGLLLLYNAYNNDVESPIEIANISIVLVGVAMVFCF
jgi:uncharacterized membrane protein HdeD (DUF308 family)